MHWGGFRGGTAMITWELMRSLSSKSMSMGRIGRLRGCWGIRLGRGNNIERNVDVPVVTFRFCFLDTLLSYLDYSKSYKYRSIPQEPLIPAYSISSHHKIAT